MAEKSTSKTPRRWPECFDPYLRFALAGNLDYFDPFLDDFGDGAGKAKLLLLVEFRNDGDAGAFLDALKERDILVELAPPLPQDGIHGSLRAGINAFSEDVDAVWQRYVLSAELSLPLVPSAMLSQADELELLDRSDGTKRRIVAVLDDGCPFAARHFLTTAGGRLSTRIRAIWDQTQGKSPVDWTSLAGGAGRFGRELVDFRYGLEFYRESSPSNGGLAEIGLDEWIALHTATTGTIDEASCYADANFTRLASRLSHGAHVLDVQAGERPPSSRIGRKDRRDPPDWRSEANLDKTDIVFVQFPENGIRDATGVWLKAYVRDAIWYVLSFANLTDPETEIVINISYGPTTGPHDGNSGLERMLRSFVTYFNGQNRPRLRITLAAGNSYETRGHVRFAADNATQASWIWRLPPDNSVLCFSEIWIDRPPAQLKNVVVRLRSPNGKAKKVPSITHAGRTMWRLEVGPTKLFDQPKKSTNKKKMKKPWATSPHGDYVIEVSAVPQGAVLDAYVARTDPNLGIHSGAKRSWFIDPAWESKRGSVARMTRVNGVFDLSESLIERRGTLNGMATDQHPSIFVNGGYRHIDGSKSGYSSVGPARAGAPRTDPDYMLMCDESWALAGIRAGGTRSGTAFRLVGTSTAAPQLARHLLRPLQPPPPPAKLKPP